MGKLLWWTKRIVVVVVLLSSGFGEARAAAPLPTKRVANTTLKFPGSVPDSGYTAVDALSGLRFDQPVCIASPPGETNRLFVLERTGQIFVITNLAVPTKTSFLDLSLDVSLASSEAGLLGMAFHPGYRTNHFFYVYRTVVRTNLFRDQLSRFETSTSTPNSARTDSELVLISQYDDGIEHNAGCIQFGPDGFLYLSVGDERPPPADRSPDPQAIDKGFFGGILRLDVDKRPGSLMPNPHPSASENYAVPADNPFVGITNYYSYAVDPGKVRTEFYAVGLRNPWRMAFDPLTGELYCADVGASAWEEVNIIRKGGNYGWPYWEGPTIVSDLPFDRIFEQPIYSYGHGYASDQGHAIIGGIVYRGSGLPNLDGSFVFGDNVSGNLWSLVKHDNGTADVRWLVSERGVASFGRDPRDGGILFANVFTGAIKKITYVPVTDATAFPKTLAETGIFSDLNALLPQPGIVPYEVNVPFWSDGAIKRRWFSVPQLSSRIQFDSASPWVFPEGTVWIKHFELQTDSGAANSIRRVETRVLVKNTDGIYGVTYRWDAGQQNATLVPAEGTNDYFVIQDGGATRTQQWHYPSRTECLVCHSPQAGFALGFNAAQLHRDIILGADGTNQIGLLSRMGYFTDSVTNLPSVRPFAAMTNANYPIGYRSRSYLSANCSQCHGNGILPGYWDARFNIRLDAARILDGLLLYDFGDPNNRVIKADSMDHSILYSRLERSDTLHMPPLGTSEIDNDGLSLLSAWISTLPPAQWQSSDIGEPVQEGYASLTQGGFTVSGAGSGISGASDSFYFLHQPLSGDLQIVARLGGRRGGNVGAHSGIMLRSSLALDAPFVMVQEGFGGQFIFRSRTAAGEFVNASGQTFQGGTNSWVKIVRIGNQISGFSSLDGATWKLLNQTAIDLGQTLEAGLAVSSGADPMFYTVDFTELSMIALTFGIDMNSRLVAPAHVILTASVTGDASDVGNVEFFSNGIKVGETSEAPFSYDWNPAPAGNFQFFARVTDTRGNAITSQPFAASVGFPKANVQYVQPDVTTKGGWVGTYGHDGYMMANGSSAVPVYLQALPVTPANTTWAVSTADPRGLTALDGSMKSLTAWSDPNEITLNLAFPDGALHRVALYFLDWDGQNTRSQIVELWDMTTQILLDRRTVSNFSGGVYLQWTLRGNTKVVIKKATGISVVLSGVFFDPSTNLPPLIRLITPEDESSYTQSNTIPIAVEVSDPDGAVAKVEIIANDRVIATKTAPPFTFSWTNALVGSYTVTARATDNLGDTALASSSFVRVNGVDAAAQFAGIDELSGGNWIGRFGKDGVVIPGLIENLPSYATVVRRQGDPYVWEGSSAAFRALQNPNGVTRFASYWWAQDSIVVDFSFLDGSDHLISLYLLDWDGGRVMDVNVIDSATGALLDTRNVPASFDGIYLRWVARGQVRFEISRESGNAVASGIFFDPSPVVQDLPIVALQPNFRSSGTGLRMDLIGNPNWQYRLEYSSDLVHWTTNQFVTVPATGIASLAFDSMKGTPTRFYRAIYDAPVVSPIETNPPVISPPLTNPPVVVPPVTNPPVVVPPLTNPPVVIPPATNPPVVVPPVTNSPPVIAPVPSPVGGNGRVINDLRVRSIQRSD